MANGSPLRPMSTKNRSGAPTWCRRTNPPHAETRRQVNGAPRPNSPRSLADRPSHGVSGRETFHRPCPRGILLQEAAEAAFFSAIAKERGGASSRESKAAVGGLPLNNFSVFGMPNSRFSETAISIIRGVAEKRTSNARAMRARLMTHARRLRR